VLPTCTTSSVLNGGSSYPAITVTVSVAANAASPQVNAVSVSGGGSAGAIATDSTTVNITVTYGVTGQATLSGSGLSGVTMTLSGPQSGSASTDGSGNFSFTGLTAGGNFTVTPSKTGYTFIPPSATFSSLSGNQTANFTASVVVATLGTLTAGSASVAPGNTYSIPITLGLNSGVSADSLTFGVQITPNGGAPALTGSLKFTKDASIADAPFTTTAGTSNAISVLWTSLSSPLGGMSTVGVVSGTVPAGAANGQSYTVAVTGVSAATGGGTTPVAVGAGTNGVLNVVSTYKVGDVYPYTSDSTPNFGNGTMDILDLIQELFAVNNIPGFRPAAGSDRFDAMDIYPVDTGTTRGGDGVLEIRDLIRELFRVNNLDMDRPWRACLGGAGHTSASGDATSLLAVGRNGGLMPIRRGAVSGALVLGAAEQAGEGTERVPIYLEARQDLLRAAVTFGLGDQRSPLRFVAAPGLQPSLVQDSQPGVVAVAWLEGVSVRAGGRLLLGYVAGPAGAAANLKVYGVSASGLDDNREVRLDAPAAAVPQQ
jgi:hypothetical protein